MYRAVGKYQREGLRTWLSEQDPRRTLTVMVGAASSGTSSPVSLADAQALRSECNPDLVLGGVAIPERHSRRENEHMRLIAKQEAGCPSAGHATVRRRGRPRDLHQRHA